MLHYFVKDFFNTTAISVYKNTTHIIVYYIDSNYHNKTGKNTPHSKHNTQVKLQDPSVTQKQPNSASVIESGNGGGGLIDNNGAKLPQAAYNEKRQSLDGAKYDWRLQNEILYDKGKPG